MCNKQEIRNSVKLILLNENNELLLMRTDDKGIQGKDGKYNGVFWQMIGGKIEEWETIEEAVYRELFEDTGFKEEQVILDKVLWYGEVDLLMHGIITRVKQSFILVKTNTTNVSLKNLTEEEKPVCNKLEWFSLDKIKKCTDIIYPILLTDEKYLPSILNDNIPEQIINIDLTKQPKRYNNLK